jgi:hypothetical protein
MKDFYFLKITYLQSIVAHDNHYDDHDLDA